MQYLHMWVLKHQLLYLYITYFSQLIFKKNLNIACVMFDMWFCHNTNVGIAFQG
jgi:hypothetical protein